MKKVYPAIFHEEDGGYWVEFPDLPGCFSEGDTAEEAFEMAAEALGVYLAASYEDGDTIARPSDITKITTKDAGFVSYVTTDVERYLKRASQWKDAYYPVLPA